MLKFKLEQANDQNLASALQKLSNLDKIDVKIRYRAGRIFTSIGKAMRDHQRSMEKEREAYCILEDGKPKVSKEGNVVWSGPEAEAKYLKVYEEKMQTKEIHVKALPFDFLALEKIDQLNGNDLVALEFLSDNVPATA